MSGINQIRTIEDLERATYGNMGQYGDIMKAAGLPSGIHGGHDVTSGGDFATSQTALYNLIYGQKVWSMLNREINAFAMLPKKPWSSSGWRVMIERAIGGKGDLIAISGGNAGTGQSSMTLDDIGGVTEDASFTTGATNPFLADDSINSDEELDDTSGIWETAALIPNDSAQANDIKSFGLYIFNENNQAVADSFEINDITIVYRVKGVK